MVMSYVVMVIGGMIVVIYVVMLIIWLCWFVFNVVLMCVVRWLNVMSGC